MFRFLRGPQARCGAHLRHALFNSLDPFPFQERDLDKNAEEFIVGWARELPRDQLIHIVLHMPAAEVQKPECRRRTGLQNISDIAQK
jgi:hypothetical protein